MRRRWLLHEGERAYGAHYFNATARMYHDVDNPLGPLDGPGPVLENDSRLIEAHMRRLSSGRPVDVVVQDLLETGKNKNKRTRPLSPNERMLANLAAASKLDIHIGN